jgi:hypothetical protein
MNVVLVSTDHEFPHALHNSKVNFSILDLGGIVYPERCLTGQCTSY